MARRHEALVSLSHDRHHGLAIALRLPQGESALLDGLTRDHHDIASMIGRQEAIDRDDLLWQLAAIGARLEELIPAEERTLFPMCEARLSQADLSKTRA